MSRQSNKCFKFRPYGYPFVSLLQWMMKMHPCYNIDSIYYRRLLSGLRSLLQCCHTGTITNSVQWSQHLMQVAPLIIDDMVSTCLSTPSVKFCYACLDTAPITDLHAMSRDASKYHQQILKLIFTYTIVQKLLCKMSWNQEILWRLASLNVTAQS